MTVDFTLAGAVLVSGLVVVFIALIGLSALVWLCGKMFVAMNKKPAKPVAPPPAAKVAPAVKASAPTAAAKPALVVEDGIGDEVIAVISAAVAAMSDGTNGFALRSVSRVKEARPAWATAGLVQNTQPF